MIRAKFIVDQRIKSEYRGSETVEVILRPVTDGSPENKAFWEATPVGQLQMQIETAAADAFVPGKEFYLDFTEAPAEKSA